MVKKYLGKDSFTQSFDKYSTWIALQIEKCIRGPCDFPLFVVVTAKNLQSMCVCIHTHTHTHTLLILHYHDILIITCTQHCYHRHKCIQNWSRGTENMKSLDKMRFLCFPLSTLVFLVKRKTVIIQPKLPQRLQIYQ